MADVGPEDSAPTLSLVTEDGDDAEAAEAPESLGTAEDISALTGLVRAIREFVPTPPPPEPPCEMIYYDLTELSDIANCVGAFSEAMKPIREVSVGHKVAEDWDQALAWPDDDVKAELKDTLLRLARVARLVIDRYEAAALEADSCD